MLRTTRRLDPSTLAPALALTLTLAPAILLADPVQQQGGPSATAVISLAGHARQARTSGTLQAGTMTALAFTAGGKVLVTGGNDDRVMLWSVPQGKRIWASAPLGKDVEQVLGCDGDHFAAWIYGGTTFVWRGAPPRRQRRPQKIAHNHGWTGGLSSGCDVVVRDGFDDQVSLYDARTGRTLRRLPVARVKGLDLRGVGLGPDWALVPQGPGRFSAVDLTAGTPARLSVRPLEVPASDKDAGALGQLQVLSGGRVLLEYYSPTDRTLRVVGLPGPGAAGEPIKLNPGGGATVAIQGHGAWSPTVPTTAAVSSDGRHMVWYRDGLGVFLVELGSGRRTLLFRRARTSAGTVSVAFHPKDPHLFAVSMDPAPHRATLYRIQGGAR